MVLSAFKSRILSLQSTEDTGNHGMVSDPSCLKILTLKQILQRLTIAVAQVKAGNTSENSLNEILQVIYSLYQARKILKKCIIT